MLAHISKDVFLLLHVITVNAYTCIDMLNITHNVSANIWTRILMPIYFFKHHNMYMFRNKKTLNKIYESEIL